MGSGVELYQIYAISEENDLAVTFSHDLKFKSYIHKTAWSANRVLGVIYRTFKCLDSNMMRQLYTSLVRPHLDFASNIWNPYLLQGMQKIQRRATKLIPSFKEYTYYERLSTINLPSLQYRCLRMI